MIKLVLLVSKRADLSAEEFRRYWREQHAPLLMQLPGLRRLVFNYALPGMDGTAPEYDGVSEDWFESAEAMQAAFGSPAGQAVFADAPNFPEWGACGCLWWRRMWWWVLGAGC
ncbi:MAG: EthD family reductase [Thermomicrobiales bacterium]